MLFSTTQKRNAFGGLPLLVRVHGFQVPFHSLAGVLPFLTVLVHYRSVRVYLALEDGSPYRMYTTFRPTEPLTAHALFVYGAVMYRAPFQTLPLTHMRFRLWPPVRSPLLGNLGFLFLVL